MAQGTAYDLAGPAGAPVVVLIHGLGLTRRTWDDFIPDLARTYRVLRYDLCGHGESDLPAQKSGLTVLAGQLRTLLDHLDIDAAALIGFSLGGMINRRFTMESPERVTALAILNSPHERTAEAQRLVEERAAATASGGPAATIEQTLTRWFTPAFRRRDSGKVDWVRNTVLANDADNYTHHRQVLASGVPELIRPDPPIEKPALVMTCENDTGSTPAMTQAIASEIPGAEVLVIPELQHLGILERPELFINPLLGFLKRAPGLKTGAEQG